MLIYWPIKRFAQTFWHWLLESDSAQFQSAQCQIDLLGSCPSETVDQRAGEIVPPSTGCDAGRLGGGPVGQSSLPASICRTQVELHFGGFPPAQDTWSISRLIAIIHQHAYVIILGNDNNKKKRYERTGLGVRSHFGRSDSPGGARVLLGTFQTVRVRIVSPPSARRPIQMGRMWRRHQIW